MGAEKLPQFIVSTDFTKMPSQMEHAMETMMFTFHKFAGDKGYLTKEDLRVLMEKEFPGFLEVRILEWLPCLSPGIFRIFLTQGSNLWLLHCRQILYHLNHWGGDGKRQSPASYHLHESKRPSGCGQNNEGPGPVSRWQSGLPELLLANRWAHHRMQ
ncbi:hypothetical protein MJT46_001020 [Ovis ammon polii x Ovis aries]|nr:hypothetical protein MJT46_001020 [Ovis ammon polii x Ovis aries]